MPTTEKDDIQMWEDDIQIWEEQREKERRARMPVRTWINDKLEEVGLTWESGDAEVVFMMIALFIGGMIMWFITP